MTTQPTQEAPSSDVGHWLRRIELEIADPKGRTALQVVSAISLHVSKAQAALASTAAPSSDVVVTQADIDRAGDFIRRECIDFALSIVWRTRLYQAFARHRIASTAGDTLKAENERLRAALEEISRLDTKTSGTRLHNTPNDGPVELWVDGDFPGPIATIASTALGSDQ